MLSFPCRAPSWTKRHVNGSEDGFSEHVGVKTRPSGFSDSTVRRHVYLMCQMRIRCLLGMKCEALLQMVSHTHTPRKQVFHAHRNKMALCKTVRLSWHQHMYRWELVPPEELCAFPVCLDWRLYFLGVSVCLRVLIYFTKSHKLSWSRWLAPACCHCLTPPCLPTSSPCRGTTAVAAWASNSDLWSPPNHFPHPITQQPQCLLIREPTIRECTRTAEAYKHQHLTRDSVKSRLLAH